MSACGSLSFTELVWRKRFARCHEDLLRAKPQIPQLSKKRKEKEKDSDLMCFIILLIKALTYYIWFTFILITINFYLFLLMQIIFFWGLSLPPLLPFQFEGFHFVSYRFCRRCYIRFIRKVNEKKGVEGQEETRKAFDFMLSYIGVFSLKPLGCFL